MKEILTSILSNTIPNITRMEELINTMTVDAMSISDKPCGMYMISKSIYLNILNTAKLEESLLKQFIQAMPPSGYVGTNPLSNLLLIYILTFFASDNVQAAYTTSRLLTCFHCGFLKRKYFVICNEDVMRYTLSNLHGHSIAKDGFSKLIIKISDETLTRYKNNFLNDIDPYMYYRYIIDIRNKMNQSMKAIAIRYYTNIESASKESFDEIAENMLNNISNMLFNEAVIDFIARLSGLSDLEVEQILLNLQQLSTVQSSFKNLLIKMLYKFGGIESMRDAGVVNIVGRARRTIDIVETAKNVLEEIRDIPVTMENILVLISAAAILITASR